MRNHANPAGGTRQLTGDFRAPEKGSENFEEEEVYGRAEQPRGFDEAAAGTQEEVDQCHDQIARQASKIHQLQIQVENLTMQLETMRERYRGVQSETASNQQSLKGQVQQLTTALQSA